MGTDTALGAQAMRAVLRTAQARAALGVALVWAALSAERVRAALRAIGARAAGVLRRADGPADAGSAGLPPRTATRAARAALGIALAWAALSARLVWAALSGAGARAASALHRRGRQADAGSAKGARSYRADGSPPPGVTSAEARADRPTGAGSAEGSRPYRTGGPGGGGAAPPGGTRRTGGGGWGAPATPAIGRGRGAAAPGPPRPHRGSALHAGAWWVWALGLGTAASRTSNPLLLGLIVAVAGYVVAVRRTDAPWARSYGAFLRLGLVVLAIRLVFAVFFGSPIPSTRVLFTLPEVPLPSWAQGVRIGGRVTAEGLVFASYEGLRLATLLVCVGAANALASPARLLKSLPGALYEAGVAVVVAMTFAPHLVADVQRLRAARRLRGRPDRGVKALLQVGLPVLEGALERSVALAAAMDARGYGRTAQVPPAVRRTTAVLTLGGLLGVCCGTYGLLASQGAAYGLPLLLAGLAAALGGLWLGGRRSVRSRYRPDRWGLRAWLVSGSGAAVAALTIWAASYAPESLNPPAVPLTAPDLPLWPAAGVLLGLLPAFVAPAPAPPVRYKTEEVTQ